MFRIWGKIITDNKVIKDHTACIEDYTISRTKKVYQALDEICMEFDLPKPIWLKKNQQDFIRSAKTRFTADNFIEAIDFDYLDFQVIEEEY